MEFQFEKDVFRFLNPVVREIQEQEQTQEIRLSDAMPDIGKVIAAWGQVILRSKEWRSDSLTLSAGVMVWVLYAPEDGSQPRCLEEWVPFRMKWDLPEGIREGDMRVNCLLRFVDGRNVSPRKILVRCSVAALMEALAPEEAEVYMPGQISPEIQLLKHTYPVRIPREAGEKTFLLDEELTLPASCPKPAVVIYCTVRPEASERKIVADKAVFRGNGNLHILYRSEEGQLHTWDFDLPYSQFAQLQDAYSSDAALDVMLSATSLETEVDSEGHIRVKCGLVGQYLVDDRRMVELVEDAYCPGRELSLETDALRLSAVLERRMENIYGEQTLPMDANVVVDCVFWPDFPRIRRSEDSLELELPGMFQALCYGENGNLQAGTVRWEGALRLPADEDVTLYPDIHPQGSTSASAGDGSVRVSGEAGLKLESMSRRGLPMVTSLELGEIRAADPGRPSLILRRAGEEGLWVLAKRYGATVDAIRSANCLEEEPASGQMLLIPVP